MILVIFTRDLLFQFILKPWPGCPASARSRGNSVQPKQETKKKENDLIVMVNYSAFSWLSMLNTPYNFEKKYLKSVQRTNVEKLINGN